MNRNSMAFLGPIREQRFTANCYPKIYRNRRIQRQGKLLSEAEATGVGTLEW